MKLKPWYRSRTMWLNILGIVAFISQEQFGFVISPELQGLILFTLNLLLRLDTQSGIAL